MLIKLGEVIKTYRRKCGISNLTVNDIHGIDINKQFFSPTKQVGKNTSNYLIVPINFFACNLMHVGRDGSIPLALNKFQKDIIVSGAYFIFENIRKDIILDDFLFLYLSRPEFDRLSTFNTDSSVRDGLSWDRFIDVNIEVPSIEIQRKYVDVYNSLVTNQKSYENGLDDLKNVCDIFLEKEKKKSKVKIDSLIIETNEKNSDLQSTDESGVSIGKTFFKTKAGASDLSNQKLVHFNEFAFNSNTSRNSNTLSIALNLNRSRIVSNTYVTFKCDTDLIIPQYLFLWFKRLEFDRYARFNSWGSARETISINELKDYHISLPHMKVQKAIVSILNLYETRKKINEKLKKQIKEICPVLIKGAIQESKGVI